MIFHFSQVQTSRLVDTVSRNLQQAKLSSEHLGKLLCSQSLDNSSSNLVLSGLWYTAAVGFRFLLGSEAGK